MTTTYTGSGGVPVNSIWRKAALAMRFRAQQIFFSNDITNDSRVCSIAGSTSVCG